MTGAQRLPPYEPTAHDVPRPAPAVHTVELDGEAVLLDTHVNRLHRLNPTATLLWRCLDGNTSIATLAIEIATAFDAPTDVVLADALVVLAHLGSEGLLSW